MRDLINIVENAQDNTFYHGTNKLLTTLQPGSWVTNDFETALSFAEEKSEISGGEPHVYELQIDDGDVDWDVISMMAGVDDERGTLVREKPVTRAR